MSRNIANPVMHAHSRTSTSVLLPLSLALVGLCLTAVPLHAQELKAHWSAAWSDDSPPQPGDSATIVLRVTIDDEWYLYAPSQPDVGPQPLTVTVPEDGPLAATGPLGAPEVIRYPDRNFNVISHVFKDAVEFTLPVAFKGSRASRATGPMTVELRYQTCTRGYCHPPRAETLIIGAGSTAENVPSDPLPRR
jgi:hypothetical protein